MKANPIRPSPNLQLAEKKITKGRKKRQIRKGRKKKEENKHSLSDSLHLDSKKKHSFQLAYSSIGIGNRLGVFTNLHFRFVFCFLFLCLFRFLHGLLLECWPCWVFVLSFLLNFSLVVLVLFLFTGTALLYTLLFFCLFS